jgi:hypothetical protein
LGCLSQTSLFGWSVVALFAIHHTKAFFISSPLEMAKMAIHIAAHALKRDVSIYAMTPLPGNALISMTRESYGTLSTMKRNTLRSLVTNLNIVLSKVLPKSTYRLGPDDLLAFLNGDLIIDEESDQELVNESPKMYVPMFQLDLSDDEDTIF